MCRHALGWKQITLFALCAAVPIVGLLLINRTFGTHASVQAQLNLGHSVKVGVSWDLFLTAWNKFTEFGFYNYHWYSKAFFAYWPAGVIAVALFIRPARRRVWSFLALPHVMLSAIVVASLLAMLISATALFGEKYNYVGLDRYYTPVKPLYFLLFFAPVMLIPRRAVRVVMCVGLIVACSWLVGQEWSRPYRRSLAADRQITPYGQFAECFSPGAAELYRWLGRQQAANLIVVSNFHEYITLETKIPALPIPNDAATLNTWVSRIRESRGIADPRVLFVLDPDNRWRDYWIKPPAEIIKKLGLKHRAETPASVSAQVFEYRISS